MTPDEIWTGDLFGRREESDQLIGFLETVANRPSLRNDGHAYVLAVDAPYGVGKSFFLKRFASHMALSHPVAFVDAWSDDLEDEPLVALAATLERAFSDYHDKSDELKKRVASVIEKTGKVAKIAAGGFLKRGAGLIITAGAVEALEGVLGRTASSNTESVTKVVDGAIDEVPRNARAVVGPSMQERIDRFNAGRAAVEAMKASLRELVAYLGRDTVYPPPIVIVIDELDRCRPNYAIKLLEEVKHLFDVEGVAFVLGMHGAALAHSVSAAYGAQFDGSAYLGRFITRRYTLKEAPTYALLSALFAARGIAIERLHGPRFVTDDRNPNGDVVALIARLIKSYGLNARDVFSVVDSIEVCLSLTGNRNLLVPYLLPLIFQQIKGSSGLPASPQDVDWRYYIGGSYRSEPVEYSIADVSRRYHEVASLSINQLMEQANEQNDDIFVRTVASATFDDTNSLSAPRNYKKLIQTVGRFTSAQRAPD